MNVHILRAAASCQRSCSSPLARAQSIVSALLHTPVFSQRKTSRVEQVDGQDYLKDDATLYMALKKVNRTGICQLDNVGTKEGTVLDLSLRTGPISHNMLYGDRHDVTNQVSLFIFAEKYICSAHDSFVHAVCFSLFRFGRLLFKEAFCSVSLGQFIYF